MTKYSWQSAAVTATFQELLPLQQESLPEPLPTAH